MDFKRAKERTKTVTIETGEDKLTMQVATTVTKGALARATEAAESGEPDAMIKFLLSTIQSWDATFDGQPAPLEYDFFNEEVGVSTLIEICRAIENAIAGTAQLDPKKVFN